MATPESKVKSAVTKILKENNMYYFFAATGGYGKSGVPDIIACVNGRFVGIECKAGNNKPTTLQEREIKLIIESGGVAFVVNEETVNLVQFLIDNAGNWSEQHDSHLAN